MTIAFSSQLNGQRQLLLLIDFFPFTFGSLLQEKCALNGEGSSLQPSNEAMISREHRRDKRSKEQMIIGINLEVSTILSNPPDR